MSVTALDLEPAFAADLGLADVAAEGRALLRLPGGQLFSARPTGPAPDRHPAHRAYVITFGRGTERHLLGDLLEACERAGRTTATLAADDREYAGLGAIATYRWEPAPLLPAPASTLARHTIAATIAAVQELDPHLVVLGLHDDWRELDQLVSHLRGTDHWEHTMVVALTEPERDLGLVSHWLGTDL